MTTPLHLLYETHSHTPLCGHAIGQPEEYAAVAFDRGLRGIIFTCHNPMPSGFSANVRMSVDQFDEYLTIVQRARNQWSGRVDVRLGLEADYFPGYESWLEDQMRWAEFHYVLGSVHPQTYEFQRQYWNGDAIEFQRIYFRLLADAAETRLFDCISHPDLVKNSTPARWQPESIMDEISRSLDRIAATGTAMELNTSGLNKIVPEMNPFPAMLSAMLERSIPVVIGGDAHEPERVGDQFATAVELLKEIGYESVSYFTDRERHDISIRDAGHS